MLIYDDNRGIFSRISNHLSCMQIRQGCTFFDPRFIPREIPRWKDLIYEKKTVLENSWEKIKLENQWKKDVKVSGKPNWICKECYDGGIVLEKLSEDVKNC